MLLLVGGESGSREARPLDLGWSEPLVFPQNSGKTRTCVDVVVACLLHGTLRWCGGQAPCVCS